MVPTLEQARRIISQGDSKPLGSNHGLMHIVDINGKPLLYKGYEEVIVKCKLQRAIFLHLLEKRVGGLEFRLRFPERTKKRGEIIELESDVLKRWNSTGIPGPILYDYDDSALLIEVIDGPSYESLVESGEYSETHHRLLLDQISNIRQIALDKEEPRLLHNDLTLYNFLYDGRAVPIDPGLVYRQNIGLRDLDAYINLTFCYTLVAPPPIGKYRPQTRETFDWILRDFIASLGKPTVQRMLDQNTSSSRIEAAYLKATIPLGNNELYLGLIEMCGPDRCKKVGYELKHRLEK